MRFVLVEERQVDIDAFNKKFGDGSFEKFNKLKGRLKNNNISVDIVYHTKNTSVEDMKQLLSDIENRVVKDKDTGETKLNRKLVAENEYYSVYDILDWETSMNMGNDTGWCIAGRYDTGGKVKPSQAKQYFNDYKSSGIRNFLFFMPKRGDIEKYCLCITNDKDKFQFWNSKDDGYAIGKIPINNTFPEFEFNGVSVSHSNGVVIENGVLKSVDRTMTGNFDVPDGVKRIEDEAFSSCFKLTSVTIPDSVTSIGWYAFHYCSRLPTIKIPDSVTSIGDNAFSHCSGLTSVTIGKGVNNIGDEVFIGCISLPSVTIPESVVSIGKYSFFKCKKLTSVTIPGNVKSIGRDAFWGCPGLTIYCEKGSYAETYAQENNIRVEYVGEQQV